MEPHRQFFRDDRHYSDGGRDYTRLLWFETLLKHDGLPVPKWCSDELTKLRSNQ